MGISQDISLRWNVQVDVVDIDSGRIIERQRVHNLVTDAGLAEMGRRIALIAPAGEDKFSVGTGTTAATSSDTAMETELYTGNVSSAEGGTASTVFRFVLPSTEGNGSTITEVGLLTYNDTLIARAILSTGIAKTSGKAISFVWSWVFANA